MTLPDAIVERCKADPVFRTVVVRQMERAIEEARFVAERMSADLSRINAACVAGDVAPSAT